MINYSLFFFIFQEKLLCPVEDTTQTGKQESGEMNEMGPKVADWRFGPAQMWYDMLDVPETGEGFNYGFKVKEKVRNLYFYISIFLIFINSKFKPF